MAKHSPTGREMRIPAVTQGRRREARRSAPVAAGSGRNWLVELREVLRDIVADTRSSQFPLSLVPGRRPQLWIDEAVRVETCDDGKTFRFLVKTRYGWQVLLESDRVELLSDLACRYVRRKRAGSSDLEPLLRSAQ